MIGESLLGIQEWHLPRHLEIILVKSQALTVTPKKYETHPYTQQTVRMVIQMTEKLKVLEAASDYHINLTELCGPEVGESGLTKLLHD